MMTPEEYIDSLRQMKTVVYWKGERIDNWVDHPAVRPHINAAALTYEVDPEHDDGVRTATSHLTGKKINRFTHIHQNPDDLVKKAKALRALGQKTGSCFQRCAGWDALNAVYGVTYEIDQAKGTDYHARFLKFLEYIQDTDKMPDGALTDPKGDRGLSPSKQADPDLFLHVVERREDGVIVRGAKLHQTGAVNSHEVVVVPTTAMGPEDADYAVSFAVPMDAPGIFCVFGRQVNDSRKEEGELDQGNACFGAAGGEAMIVFDNVFVPWERVFMCGEYEFSRMLVERFASYHRANYGACKVGVADVLLGACTALAKYQGTSKASHIKDKLTEMAHLIETMHCCSLACAYEGSLNASGQCYVDPLLANVTKLNVTRHTYELTRLAHDIAGGILGTMPSEQDLEAPEIGPFVEKYCAGVAGVPVKDRFRIIRLIEALSLGSSFLVESMHGAGSPQAMKVMIQRQVDFEGKARLATDIAGITESKETAAVKKWKQVR